jgi:hypothetical protein
MATTFNNDLRLTEIVTGTEEGNWGTLTNTNMVLLGEAFGYGEEAISDAATAAITIADGAADAARSLYLKITGSLSQACTITMGPNTSSRVMIIENGTSDGGGGPWDIIISQGSGSTVTIPNGESKMIYMDGIGATSSVVDAMAAIKVLATRQPDHVYSAAPATIADSAVPLTIDWNSGNMVRIDNTGDPISITPSNPVAGGNYAIIIKATGTAANWTTWPVSFKWRNNTAPTLPTTLNESSVIVLIYDGSNYLASYTLDHPA